MPSLRKITFLHIRKPNKTNLNEELQWFSQSLGLFTERDKERSCFRIFVELLKAARRNQALTSDQLALKTNLSRGTVVHHLARLRDAGMVLHDRNTYLLRTNNLDELIEEMRKDTLRMLDDLQLMAERLDEELGLHDKKKRRTGVISD